jgi:hypothetical protein
MSGELQLGQLLFMVKTNPLIRMKICFLIVNVAEFWATN